MRYFILLVSVLVLTISGFSQTHHFKFNINDRSELEYLTRIISIDNVQGKTVDAYANDKEWNDFIRLGYSYESFPYPEKHEGIKMTNDPAKVLLDWDYYPTLGAYIALMNSFAFNYPSLCTIVNIGTSIQGRPLLFAKISHNINVREPEPEFMYTSSMHGDELTGYVLMLHLINYLLTNYGTDPKVTNLLNNTEIWINPLANPDGTFHGGDSTVNGAVRYNANNVDLNRNYPDPVMGLHPDGHAWQQETINFMNVAASHRFVMSCNFHGGAEVVNYPWDSKYALHPDNDWYVRVSRQYADTVHAYAVSGYMTDLNNGITNGAAWYIVYGGRQDYMNYWHHDREVTIELSHTKTPPANQLPAFWNYNYRSFLNYIQACLYGVTGIVTDSATGQPLKAKVFISGHDFDSSEVYSDSVTGKYNRPIIAGNYNITYSCPGYYPKTINNIHASNDSTTIINVQLRRDYTSITNNRNNTPSYYKLYQNFPNPFNPSTIISFDIPSASFVVLTIYDASGRALQTLINRPFTAGHYETEWNASNYSSGIYFYKLEAGNYAETRKMILLK
jgi:hypothetical protein